MYIESLHDIRVILRIKEEFQNMVKELDQEEVGVLADMIQTGNEELLLDIISECIDNS